LVDPQARAGSAERVRRFVRSAESLAGRLFADRSLRYQTDVIRFFRFTTGQGLTA